jgi:hypothetical protein
MLKINDDGGLILRLKMYGSGLSGSRGGVLPEIAPGVVVLAAAFPDLRNETHGVNEGVGFYYITSEGLAIHYYILESHVFHFVSLIETF